MEVRFRDNISLIFFYKANQNKTKTYYSRGKKVPAA